MLQKMFPDEIIKVDSSAFRGYPLHNGYEIPRIFGEIVPEATFTDVLKYTYPTPHYKLWQFAYHCLPMWHRVQNDISDREMLSPEQLKYYLYFNGYWQKAKYYETAREEILRAFSFHPIVDTQNNDALKFIAGGETSSIHVRRGDYVGHPIFGNICTVEYYKHALQALSTNAPTCRRLLVFSNGIEWTRTVLYDAFPDFEVMFVNCNNGKESYRDMHLMSKCHHNIIANSSFSWWGAWLNANPHKVVIAPSKWRNSDDNMDIVPNSWLRISIGEK
jgi:hypothetical protein